MAFKIIPKINVKKIQDKSLDIKFLGAYYTQVQQTLIQKTSPEKTTDYFFCKNFSGGDDLLVFGTQTMEYKTIFKETGKGKHGFDKDNISFGACFVLKEKGNNILCLLPDTSASKGKETPVIKALKKLLKSDMKKLSEVRWLKGPIVVDAQDKSKIEVVTEDAKKTDSTSSKPKEPLVKKEDIVKRTKDIQKAIDKLLNDVMPRYKKRETTANDAAFVNALRKASSLFLSKLAQTDKATSKAFESQKNVIEKGMPQWLELENNIHQQKDKKAADAVLTQAIKDTVSKMNTTRNEIKEILERVDLKSLG